MSEDNNIDSIPEKDKGDLKGRTTRNPKITRDENEDRLLRISEENAVLKKHLRKQEDRIKQLATKLVRVIGEKTGRGKREDILIEDQKVRIVELEGQVHNLREKLLVTRQQLGSYTKLVPGLKQIKAAKSTRSATSSGGHTEGHLLVPDQVTRLLLEAKGENNALHNQLKELHGRWSGTEQEILTMREQLRLKDIEHEDEMMALRGQIESEHDSKRNKLADNIQLIRLQRDSRRTASWLSSYETQCKTLETNLSAMSESLRTAEADLATAQQELREEQTRGLNLLKQVEDTASFQHQLKELQAQISALQDDNQILRQSNDSLVSKALESTERVRRVENQDDSLKDQVASLENSVRVELQAKSELLSALSQETAKFATLELKLESEGQKSKDLAAQVQALELKVKAQELEAEAKQSAEEASAVAACEKCTMLETECNQTTWKLLQLKDELLKTKNLLKTQISINKEYQKEIDIQANKLERAEVFHNEKFQELMKVFEEKSSRMSLIEKNVDSLNAQAQAKTPPHAFILHGDHSLTSRPRSPIVPEAISPPPLSPKSPSIPEPAPALLMLEILPLISDGEFPVEQGSSQSESSETEASPVSEVEELSDPSTVVEEDLSPSIQVEIDRFVPTDGQILPSLFITLNHKALERSYSNIVSNGIFNHTLSQAVPADFKMEQLGVQLHQAIGSDCRTLGNAWLQLGDSIFSPIIELGKGIVIGQLLYTCILHNLKPSSNNNDENIRNHNVAEPRAPVPVPRKLRPFSEHNLSKIEEVPETQPKVQTQEFWGNRSNVQKVRENDTKIDQVREHQSKVQEARKTRPKVHIEEIREHRSKNDEIRKNRSHADGVVNNRAKTNNVIEVQAMVHFPTKPIATSSPKSTKKSILRKDFGSASSSPKSGGRHVTVNDTIEERQIESGFDTESQSSREDLPANDLEKIQIPGQCQYHVEEPSSADSVNSKRRIRRRLAENAELDLETDVSIASAGTETSRNISEIESEDEETLHPEVGMRIEISYVVFNSKCRIWNDARIKRFYIEYRFLNYASEELETPNSVAKPQPGRRAEFNSVKALLIDTKEKRRLLREMLKSRTRLQFTLVSEPAENDTIDCEDIGYAYVSMNDILQDEADIVEEEIPIFDAENTRVETGVLCVSVQALDALKSL